MKKLLLGMLLCIFFIPIAFAQSAINVLPATDSATVNPSATVSKNVTISNSGATSLSVTLPSSVTFTSSQASQVLTITYNQTSLVLVPSGGEVDVNYGFTLPSNLRAGTYNAVFNFNSVSPHSDQLSFTLNVNAVPSMSIANISATIAQGQVQANTLTLTNTGNSDITATITKPSQLVSTTNPANTIPGANINIGTSPVSVPFQGSGTSVVTVTVPASTPLGIYEGDTVITFGSQTKNVKLRVTVVTPSYSLGSGTVTFSTTARNQTISTSFGLKNTGNAIMTNVRINHTVGSQFMFTITTAQPFSLNPGETKTLNMQAFIPFATAIGSTTAGALTVRSDQQNFTNAYNVVFDVLSKLEIETLRVFIDNKQDSDVKNGDEIEEDANPGSKIEIQLRVENLFDEDNEDIDIEDITATVTLLDNDNEEVDEDELDFGDLNSEEKSEYLSMVFTLPLDSASGTYPLKIHVEGTDENEVEHVQDWTVNIKVTRDSHDILIERASVFPETLSCSRTSVLDVTITNIGNRNEDEARLRITNDALDLDVNQGLIELDEDPDSRDNSYSLSRQISLPANFKAGTYPILIRVFYEDTILIKQESIDLKVEECKAAEEEPEEENNTTPVIVQQPPAAPQAPTIPTLTGIEPDVSSEEPLSSSPLFIAAVILGNLVILGGIGALVVKFFVLSPK